MDLVGEAALFSAEAHRGQEYEDGQEFFRHPEMAAEFARNLGYPDEVVVACYLHDVVENTEVTERQLRAAGYPDVVIDAVMAVTYTDQDEQMGVDKITKAKEHPVGHAVKICDSSASFAAAVESGSVRGGNSYSDTVNMYFRFMNELLIDLPTPDKIREILEVRDMTDHIHQSNLIEEIDSPLYDKQSRKAWMYLLQHEQLTDDVVRKVQEMITLPQRDLPQNAKGEYRNVGGYNVWIGGRKAPEPSLIPMLMSNWLQDYDGGTPTEAHVQFERIHPFGDGNGRTGRMLMWWQELQLGQEPTLVDFKERYEYYEWFRQLG